MFKRETKESKEDTKKRKEVINKKKAELKEEKRKFRIIKIGRRFPNNFGRLLNYFIFDRKGQPSKKDYNNPNPVEESIYPKGEALGKYCKRFNWIHRFFKTILFVPALNMFGKIVGKRLDKEVEDTWYNKNIKVLDDSWEETMQVMAKYMRPTLPQAKSYKITKKIMLTLILNDSITREFMNVMLHTITRRMQELYKGKKEVYHVFYTDTVSYNPVYFTMVRAVMEGNKSPANVQLETLNKQEKILHKEEQKLRKERAEVIKQKHYIHMQQKAEEQANKDMNKTVPPIIKEKSTFEPEPKPDGKKETHINK